MKQCSALRSLSFVKVDSFPRNFVNLCLELAEIAVWRINPFSSAFQNSYNNSGIRRQAGWLLLVLTLENSDATV